MPSRYILEDKTLKLFTGYRKLSRIPDEYEYTGNMRTGGVYSRFFMLFATRYRTIGGWDNINR
ncbi:hypothetical protein CSTERLE_01140 [Thermoclostridium stercorarium subsp. leptospartum DSM 9219]|uniref:Uncharacterized protein n=1 Tax=Thermoclostridium stercorarium subsp. leptospartum DSM 9219 TaxID=1346611 RepID=A0A1B1YHT8_THEST|nr:hypothetical protein CSTERLE_01140 [Thermoclostridium stercorarium subsp. leptospartum DSM 9219]